MDRHSAEVCKDLIAHKVPEGWKRNSFLSMKTIYPWIADLQQKASYYDQWIENGKPKAFWISAFFNPQAFLMAVQQNHSRKHSIATEKLRIRTKVIDGVSPS